MKIEEWDRTNEQSNACYFHPHPLAILSIDMGEVIAQKIQCYRMEEAMKFEKLKE